jgi:hypothetical protein
MLPEKRQQEVKKLNEIVNNPDFMTPADVEQFFIAYTKLIWNYKMIGTIYDYYIDDVIIHAEDGGKDIVGVEAVVRNTVIKLNAIPDYKTSFSEIFAVGDEASGYKFVQITIGEGTSAGPSLSGPATGKKVTNDNVMTFCECHVKKINGKWKVVEEWVSGSGKRWDAVYKGYDL